MLLDNLNKTARDWTSQKINLLLSTVRYPTCLSKMAMIVQLDALPAYLKWS